MRFSKMHFRNVKRALLIFTPSEMHLQRVKKNNFLKNSLRLEVANSPQPFSSSCSSLLFLHSMGGVRIYVTPPSNKQLESIQSRVRASDFFKVRIVKLVSGIFEKIQGSNVYFSGGKI